MLVVISEYNGQHWVYRYSNEGVYIPEENSGGFDFAAAVWGTEVARWEV